MNRTDIQCGGGGKLGAYLYWPRQAPPLSNWGLSAAASGEGRTDPPTMSTCPHFASWGLGGRGACARPGSHSTSFPSLPSLFTVTGRGCIMGLPSSAFHHARNWSPPPATQTQLGPSPNPETPANKLGGRELHGRGCSLPP